MVEIVSKLIGRRKIYKELKGKSLSNYTLKFYVSWIIQQRNSLSFFSPNLIRKEQSYLELEGETENCFGCSTRLEKQTFAQLKSHYFIVHLIASAKLYYYHLQG